MDSHLRGNDVFRKEFKNQFNKALALQPIISRKLLEMIGF